MSEVRRVMTRHDRLAMLHKALNDGWLTDDVLTDDAFFCLEIKNEDIQSADQENSRLESQIATAISEKKAKGEVSGLIINAIADELVLGI